MNTIKSLQDDIKTLLRSIQSRSIDPEAAARGLQSLERTYNELKGRRVSESDRSHLKGLLYQHNVRNLCKATGYFVIDPEHREISFSGNRELITLITATVNDAVRCGSRRTILKKGLRGDDRISCFWYTFTVKDEIHAVLTITSSSYFDEERFQRICRIIESIADHQPGQFAYRNDATSRLQALMAQHHGDAYASVYGIDGINRVLSHTVSSEYIAIHETICSSLAEHIPEGCEVFSASPFRYIVIGDRQQKRSFSITIREIIVTFTVRQYRLNDPAVLYHLLWEA